MRDSETGRASLRTEIGRMTWTHANGSVMVISFGLSHYANETEPYGMMREFLGTDRVVRRGFAGWRDIEGARAEWRSMVERYTARGWERHETFPCFRCGKDIGDDVDAIKAGVCWFCRGEDSTR